jgi:hypothetical protein
LHIPIEAKEMKRFIGVLICFLGVSSYGATEERKEKFAATLPDGLTVELVGLRSYSVQDPQRRRDRSGPWWMPDGIQLTTSPDERFDCCSWSDSYLFVITIEGKADCTYKAVGPWDNDLTVQPARDTDKGKEFASKDLRRFTLRCGDRKSTDIQLGVANGDWQILEHWKLSETSTPYDHFFVSSEQVIMRCPEQNGADVIAEVTQTITDRATRLVVFDRQSNQYASYGDEGGNSSGLVRYIHRFRNLDINSIEHIEFQTRPYDYWITFSNVSLRPGDRTQVRVEIKRPGYLLVGEVIPKFDGIRTGFPAEELKNKVLLVCFFDMNQRPSRSCITELAKQASQLREKAVTVVAVQATRMDQNTLNEWVKKNSVPFAVGMVEGDSEKTRFAWGVRSLPWLILTDTRHVVVAEGFVLSELNEKLIKIIGE